MKIATLVVALAVTVSACFVLVQDVRAQVRGDSNPAIREFVQEYGPHWEVKVHPAFGTPELIQASTPLGIFADDGYSIVVGGRPLEEKARNFLQSHSALFGLEERNLGRDLVYFSTQRGAHRSLVRFVQKVNDIPVVGHGYQLFFNEAGELTLVLGPFDPDIQVETVPTISSAAARGRSAQRASELSQGVLSPESITATYLQTVIVNEPRSPYLGFVISVTNEATGLDAVMHVDAATGSVRAEQSRALPVAGGDGFDFPRPVAPFAVPFADLAAADHVQSQRDATYGTVYATIPADGSPANLELDELTSYSYLIGNASDSQPTSGTRVSAGPDFFYAANSVGLDEVNVYYHVTAMNAYMEDLFGMNFPSIVSKTFALGSNNAFYIPATNSLAFTSALHNAGITSRDDDVIRHEFTHYAMWDQGFETVSPSQTPLGINPELHEAFSDYFAAAFDGDPSFGRWLSKCSTTGDLRNLDNDALIYYDGNNLTGVNYSYCGPWANKYLLTGGNSNHHNSMKWSGALWDLRDEIGAAETTDYVVDLVKELEGSTYSNLDAIASSYIDQVDLTDRCAVKNVFFARGMSSACDPYAEPDPEYAANISGTNEIYTKGNRTFTVADNAGGSGTTYTWYYQNLGGSSWSNVGTGTSYTRFIYTNHPHFKLKVDAVHGQSSATAYHTAYVYNGGGGGSPKNGDDSDSRIADAAFALQAAFPNPANAVATITFTIPTASDVRVVAFDLMGRRVADLASRSFQAGTHSLDLDVSALPAGVYVYRLTAGTDTAVRRLTIVR